MLNPPDKFLVTSTPKPPEMGKLVSEDFDSTISQESSPLRPKAIPVLKDLTNLAPPATRKKRSGSPLRQELNHKRENRGETSEALEQDLETGEVELADINRKNFHKSMLLRPLPHESNCLLVQQIQSYGLSHTMNFEQWVKTGLEIDQQLEHQTRNIIKYRFIMVKQYQYITGLINLYRDHLDSIFHQVIDRLIDLQDRSKQLIEALVLL